MADAAPTGSALEVALLQVRPAQTLAFEAEFGEATAVIVAMPAYQQWRALLHHFYDPFPTVLHYRAVVH